MVAELSILMPGFSFDTIMEFYWEELKMWHEKAIQTTKKLRGSK